MKKLIILLLAACSAFTLAADQKELYATLTDNIPIIGKTNEVFLGDRMLAQREGRWQECIIPVDTLQRKADLWAEVVHKGGEPLCKRSATGKKDRYYANYPNYIIRGGMGAAQSHEVQWKPKGNKSKLCLCPPLSFCGNCVKNIRSDQVDEQVTFVYRPNSIQQVIEYTGRNEDMLTFTYSEFRNGYALEAYNRQFQVDLAKGNVIAFKGAVLEVLEATNVQISYKVIRNFSES